MAVLVRVRRGPSAIALLMLMGASACATGEGPSGPWAQPKLITLSHFEAALGEPIEVVGQDFPTDDRSALYLVFDGEWTSDDGERFDVQERFRLLVENSGSALWATFGPYAIPFGHGNETGRFEGEIYLDAVGPGGESAESNGIDGTFRVEPSIVVNEFQPTTARCNGPVERAIGGIPYQLRVETVGFEAQTITYRIEAPALRNLQTGPALSSFREIATGRFGSYGEAGEMVLPPVPEELQFYAAIVTVEALDTTGVTHSTAFAIGVRRPIEVAYDGNEEVIEVLAAEPVTGCTPGGVNGKHFKYKETTVDVRSRSYNVNWDETWMLSHSTLNKTSATYGETTVNGIGVSTRNGEFFSWGTITGADGKISAAKLVEGGIGGRRNYLRNEKVAQETVGAQTRRASVSDYETTTETVRVSEEESSTEAEQFEWIVTSKDKISQSLEGEIIAGTYGVFYRQPVRIRRRAQAISYNLCGKAEVIGDVDFTDWKWGVDLALANECTPLPTPNLPAPYCDADCER